MGRNFLLVSHADCVGACLTLIPGAGNIEKVHFGGHFVAFQNNKDVEVEDNVKLWIVFGGIPKVKVLFEGFP